MCGLVRGADGYRERAEDGGNQAGFDLRGWNASGPQFAAGGVDESKPHRKVSLGGDIGAVCAWVAAVGFGGGDHLDPFDDRPLGDRLEQRLPGSGVDVDGGRTRPAGPAISAMLTSESPATASTAASRIAAQAAHPAGRADPG